MIFRPGKPDFLRVQQLVPPLWQESVNADLSKIQNLAGTERGNWGLHANAAL